MSARGGTVATIALYLPLLPKCYFSRSQAFAWERAALHAPPTELLRFDPYESSDNFGATRCSDDLRCSSRQLRSGVGAQFIYSSCMIHFSPTIFRQSDCAAFLAFGYGLNGVKRLF
jgi:hypothetical protein